MAVQNETKQPHLIALCSVMLCIAVFAIVLRFWSNWLSPKHRFGYDDLFALLALPFIIGETALIYWWITDFGLGLHAATLPPEHVLQGPKITFIAAFLYDAAICLPKFSALFFYRRIFQETSQTLTYCLWVVGALNAGWLVSAYISTIFECVPVHALWDPVARAAGARCFDTWKWFLGTAVSSMIIDVMILIMPLPLLWNLQATWRRRAVVSLIFICGYCVVVVSIGRVVALGRAGSGLLTDYTWSTITYIMWLQCEGPISVLSVSLPNIVYLFRHAHENGWKGLMRPGTTQKEVSHDSSITARSAASTGRFIRLDTYTSVKSESGPHPALDPTYGVTQDSWSGTPKRSDV